MFVNGSNNILHWYGDDVDKILHAQELPVGSDFIKNISEFGSDGFSPAFDSEPGTEFLFSRQCEESGRLLWLAFVLL